MSKNFARVDTLKERLRACPIAGSMLPADLEILASAIAAALAVRDDANRTIDTLARKSIRNQIDSVKIENARSELRRVNAQIALWAEQCGLEF